MWTSTTRLSGRALRALPAIAALVAAVGVPTAASAAAAPGPGKAIVLRRLDLAALRDLKFGSIVATNTAGSVTIDAGTGARTATGGAIPVLNDHQTAQFGGAGRNNQFLSVSLRSNTIQLTGPGAPMTVRNFHIAGTPTTPISTSPVTARINSPTGAYMFTVGATVDVNANQAPGTYTGTFEMIVVYL